MTVENKPIKKPPKKAEAPKKEHSASHQTSVTTSSQRAEKVKPFQNGTEYPISRLL
jgi:hypothetical protein